MKGNRDASSGAPNSTIPILSNPQSLISNPQSLIPNPPSPHPNPLPKGEGTQAKAHLTLSQGRGDQAKALTLTLSQREETRLKALTLTLSQWERGPRPTIRRRSSSPPAAPGRPRACSISHGNFDAQVEQIRDFYGIQPGEIDLPAFRCSGCSTARWA